MFDKTTPKILRILEIDYWAFIAVIFPVSLWAFLAYDWFIVKERSQDFFNTVLIISGVAVLGFVWRWVSIRNFFIQGVPVKGQIHRISFYRGRGQVAYIYTYQGQKFLRSNTVRQVKRTRALRIGDEVELLIDENHPKRAIIRSLYLEG